MTKRISQWAHPVGPLAFALLLTLPSSAKAGLMLVTDPAQVAPNASVNWNFLGPPFTPITPPLTLSSGGVNLTIVAGDDFTGAVHTIFPQDLGGSVYLTTMAGAGPGGALAGTLMTIIFDQPIQAFGADFSATAGRLNSIIAVEALGANGVALPNNFFTLAFNNGRSDFSGYAGVSSDQANIYQVRFGARGSGSAVLNLGPLDFNSPTAAPSVAVPEPSVLGLFGAGLIISMGFLLRRRVVFDG